ncbi:MAG: UDP-N-acetylmuramoylalanyl-D-glutamyl-2,6-diaminopimelate--D-alanyl-D-alanine ligase (EC [uncultured Sulfurovum sp.]|uniref:UDP-N-acetylmuramoylalanyl-D-glutamyl-2,6-diamino pimelate--D-alanyl-D-alanine ligase (EC) n=1 Tax=uncultured Sulfurovum sp. TaxID=269237 RepID=A0A6S6U1N0_9BACT|nr:MAG: UDP-N-acetylmuramoylalanyl-D-glutamyl-2,6-diaminopimelate--D-alanyl-D-alanine ligase (EC [uncultured Sulfurovum sp.]
MNSTADLLNILSNILFVLALGYYFMTNMQWYSYKLTRVLFHHTKTWWHLVYFLIPVFLYFIVNRESDYSIVVAIVYIAMIYMWRKEQDKPLVFTGRVKRFFVALIFFTLFFVMMKFIIKFDVLVVFIPLFLAYMVSAMMEKMLFLGFQKKAEKKLASLSNMIVVGITASYGKTSIKNYIVHLVSKNYKVYATPRSVNTFGGVLKDINDDLPSDTEVYVVEMGARGKGDIREITEFVNPHLAVVGKIGPAHIEYFGNLENIRNTKMELLSSERLKEAWVHDSAKLQPIKHVHSFGKEIHDIRATLDGLDFKMDDVEYHANILGSFNAMNLAAAIKVAKALEVDDEMIKKQLNTLEPTAHRLQRMDAGGKVIIDDSFNGNIDGMMEGFNLASTYEGRKVVITPGLVEVDDAFNVQVAERANEVFDLVVVTGDLNYAIFKKQVDADKLVKLESKDKMQEILIEHTKAGDLILFANDAPSFI